MLEALFWGAAAIALFALVLAWDASRDLLHPVFFLAPMLGFLYCWMPLKLLGLGALDAFFDRADVAGVQGANLVGAGALLFGCLAGSWGTRFRRGAAPEPMSALAARRLLLAGAICGTVGSAAWLVSIVNVGGFVNAFSQSHAGGWDDSGYVRDSSLLLFSAVILILSTAAARGFRPIHAFLLAVFVLPIAFQSLLGSRRGPTFAIFTVLVMSWYLFRNRRPSSFGAVGGAAAAAYLILFLIANRDQIHLGSDWQFTTDVQSNMTQRDAGNEFIYGTGCMLASEKLGNHFWGRRYLAQVLVRPVPSSIWPTKYEDFGVEAIKQNAGTDLGIGDTLGWRGAPGSAPGIVADLFVEGSWLAIPALLGLGWLYGRAWKLAITRGGVWAAQYSVFSALSIYLVMQTMEAVIFRLLLLSIPLWIAWKWAERPPVLD